jgi:hypothetical protein
MALLRRAPREVYRVFNEADFLADGDAGELFEPATREAAGRRPRRIAGIAMLLGAVAAVGAMLVMNHPRAQVPRRTPAPPAPSAAGGEARLPGALSATGATSARAGSRELPGTVPLRRRRVVARTRSERFAASVRAPVERSREGGGGGSTPLEQGEFSFER